MDCGGAWALLIQGAAWNANVARATAPSCFYLKDGIFAGGAVLTLAATALGLTSFIMMRRQAPASATAAAAATAVHATGQPQFPAPAPATNKPSELPPPHAVVAMGQPQFWPAAAAQAQPQHAGNAMGAGHQQFPQAAAAGAPNKLGEQPPAPPTWAPTGHPQPQFSPPQAFTQPQPTSYPPQYPIQPHHQVYMQVPVLSPTAPPQHEQAEAANGVRREDLVKAGA